MGARTGIRRVAMQGRLQKGLLLLAAAAWLLTPAPGVEAEDGYDPDDVVYATGAVFESEADLADKPRTPLFRAFLPPATDLSDRLPRPGEQGEQGSCVGWAVGYAARSYYVNLLEGRRLDADAIPSPAYIYDMIRDHGTDCDAGSEISDALDLLKRGAVAVAEYPYDERRCRRPGPRMVAQASGFRITGWELVDVERLDQVKGELAGGHPVVIGMRPNRDFHRLRGTAVWRAGGPQKDDGHHAVTVVGYSEPGQYFHVVNSWGRGWGDGGFGRIAYETFRKRVKYGFVMRVVDKVDPLPEPDPLSPSPDVTGLTLPAVGCGRLAVEERDGKWVVVGFVGKPEDLSRIRAATASVGASVVVDVRPWPQCEALMTIEKPLGQASRPSVALLQASYRAAETIAFDVRMAAFPGYLHVAYLQADGNVVNLVQSDPFALATLPAGAELRFGDGLEGRAKFTVAAPFGNEMIVALASRSPLFDEDRPLVETEREFLTALRKALLARPDPAQPERMVAAGFAVLETAKGD